MMTKRRAAVCSCVLGMAAATAASWGQRPASPTLADGVVAGGAAERDVPLESRAVRRVEIRGEQTGSTRQREFTVVFGPYPADGAGKAVGWFRTPENPTFETGGGYAAFRGWRPRARTPRASIGSEGTTFVVWADEANARDVVFLLSGSALTIERHGDGAVVGKLASAEHYVIVTAPGGAPTVSRAAPIASAPADIGGFIAHVRTVAALDE